MLHLRGRVCSCLFFYISLFSVTTVITVTTVTTVVTVTSVLTVTTIIVKYQVLLLYFSVKKAGLHSIGATIRTGRDSHRLPYAGFLVSS